MKVMYIDIEINGHHETYLRALTSIPGKENVLVLPQKLPEFEDKQYVFQKTNFYKKNLREYYRWTREIKNIIKVEHPDIIHFLYGDVFYKFFGLGLEGLRRQYKVVNTIHALKKGRIGLLSLNRIANRSSVCVFHTDAIIQSVKEFGINNIAHIEYPQFLLGFMVNRETAREYYGIKSTAKVLGCIGGTRYDKGLDVLLKALQTVRGDFELLIAGAEDAITKDEIEKLSVSYKEKVHLHLSYLSNEELEMAFCATDFIVLPYRKSFNGASGPLGEAVGKEKIIIGPNHGSLNQIIEDNHIGYTFETENVLDLAETIQCALTQAFRYDAVAMRYKNSLGVDDFIKKYEQIYKMCSLKNTIRENK